MEAEGAVTCGTVLDQFVERKEVRSIVASLPQTCKELRDRELTQERFTNILDRYQEQPHLLDPHLELLIGELFALTRGYEQHPVVRYVAFQFLYLLSKVRGPKVIIRWFPHEVSDMEPALALLQEQDPHDHQTWETRYILLLWLSILIMNPFDLSRMDGEESKNGPGHKTIDRIFDIARFYIAVGDKCRDAASFLLAKFLSRPDVKRLKMESFLEWALQVIESSVEDGKVSDGSPLLCGVLDTLSSLFKHGKREDVLDLATPVLSRLGGCDLTESDNTQLRKLHVKLMQWVGMVFLPPRLASWRYQRGGRSLEEALATSPGVLQSSQEKERAKEEEEEEEEGYEVPSEIEEVLGALLAGLQDRDTVVRWAAAKGVGRVTGRLPRQLADEVLHSLLDFFTFRGFNAAWHGGSLALAELGRRGLLLPQRLSDVVPVVLKALAYDERYGASSVGAHVRDAACYVCWSFARAYQPEELHPYVAHIASGLLITMLFDREVNCRRAASAAFQENVGRQGTFPHGIDILTAADYFAVGNRENTYLVISLQVAEYPEYTRPLIDHLFNHKLSHWDSVVRELASKALYKLTPLDSLYVKDTIFPSLLPLITSSDPCLRHGALYAMAEVSLALSGLAKEQNQSFAQYVGPETIKGLLEIAPLLEDSGVLLGEIGKIMRLAFLKFIDCMCTCQLPAHGHPILQKWQAIVDENLAHAEEEIVKSAVLAFSGLCCCYYSHTSGTGAQDELILFYVSQLKHSSHFVRMGFSLALGGLPRSILVRHFKTVLESLLESCSNLEQSQSKYSEARANALHSITEICVKVHESTADDLRLTSTEVEAVFKTYSKCLRDYTTDSRGDIGATVREAAMEGIQTLSSVLAAGTLLTPEIMSEAVCGLVQQSNEKIDRTRAHACRALMSMIFHDPALPHIPHHSQLKELFRESVEGDLNWLVPRLTFPLTVQLLDMPCYRYPTLLGLLVSVGGLTESTVRQSSSALLKYLRTVSSSVQSLEPLADALLQILGHHYQQTRVILPFFKTLDLLLSSAVFDVYSSVENPPFPPALLELLKKEMKGCKDPIKILASINVFCGLLQFPTIRQQTLNHVMLLLCHNFPRVRKTAGDQFYVTLLTYDDLLEEDVADNVMGTLSDTPWDGPIAGVREKRNLLCQLFHLPIPKLVAKSGGKPRTKAPRDELASYKDLVERAGY